MTQVNGWALLVLIFNIITAIAIMMSLHHDNMIDE